VRYRAKLVALRSGLKAPVHAVMAKEGVLPTVADMFGGKGNAQLDAMAMAHSHTTRVASLRDLIELYDREVAMLEREIHRQLRSHRGYQAIHAINSSGPTIAAILVAEAGDVTRFRSPEALCSWTGLTPKHRESDTTVRRGRITKQGSKLVRWAVIEAVSRYHGGPRLAADFRQHVGQVDGVALVVLDPPLLPVQAFASPSGAAPTRRGWRWPARYSRSSTTAYATARSVASLGSRRRETARTRPGASP
jgi:transposase